MNIYIKQLQNSDQLFLRFKISFQEKVYDAF